MFCCSHAQFVDYHIYLHVWIPVIELKASFRILLEARVMGEPRSQFTKTCIEVKTAITGVAVFMQDLTAYKKYREKQVSSAARALIATFRDIAPYMLNKKDRGRGADLDVKPQQYGATDAKAC